MAAGNLVSSVKYHFQETEPYYIVLLIALAAGSCAGAFTFGCLNEQLMQDAAAILSNYNYLLKRGIGKNDVIYEAVKGNTTFAVILYVCSFTPAALAAGVFLLATKGFCIGFMAAGIIKCFPTGTAFMLLLKSLPCQFIVITSLVIMAGIATMYCKKQWTILKNTIIFLVLLLLSFTGIICEVFIKC